jgi:phospholipid N-methyltransferase
MNESSGHPVAATRSAAAALPGRWRRLRASGDLPTFLRAWLRDPITTASLVPSSQALARLITLQISSADGPVIELGPGTGVFTRALIARGVAESDLFLIEMQRPLVEVLRRRFPAACVLQMDATQLASIEIFDRRPATAAISGLPILWMPRPEARKLLRGLFARMLPGAALYQFTYQRRCPVPDELLASLGLGAKRIGWTLANFPPAAVYRISRVQP